MTPLVSVHQLPNITKRAHAAQGSYRKGFAVAHDGTPLYYEVCGQPSPAQTLVFCDGIGCDGYVWKYLTRILSEEYRLIHVHYRGHGQTPRPRDPTAVSIEHLADDVAVVLDACETKQAVVFGHSLGVQVALETYRRHANRVLGLVLLCGSHSHTLRTFRGGDFFERWWPWMQRFVSVTAPLSNWLWSHVAPTMLAYRLATTLEINGRLIRQEDFLPYFASIARVDLRVFTSMLAHASKHTTYELLPDVRVPTFILAGRRDSFTPLSLSLDMQKRIPDAELYVIEEGSHTAPIERPLEVSSKIAEFLDRRLPNS